MRTATFLLCLCLLACSDRVRHPVPSEAGNCGLSAPPAGSGETINHGLTLRIFPRLVDMPADYTGCQTLWVLAQDGQWWTMNVVHFEHGQVVRSGTPGTAPGSGRDCHYRDGKLVQGSPKECVEAKSVPMESLPLGCIDRLGIHGEHPSDCRWE